MAIGIPRDRVGPGEHLDRVEPIGFKVWEGVSIEAAAWLDHQGANVEKVKLPGIGPVTIGKVMVGGI